MSGAEARADLLCLLRERLRGRVVVMGIGNPWREDDGAGCAVARSLCQRASGRAGERANRTVIIDAEEIPESHLGPVVSACPDVVLLVDAVDLGAPAGTAALLEADELDQGAVFTHRTPLHPLAEYLRRETGADVLLLGIQPERCEFGNGLTAEVEAAVQHVATLLEHALSPARPKAALC